MHGFMCMHITREKIVGFNGQKELRRYIHAYWLYILWHTGPDSTSCSRVQAAGTKVSLWQGDITKLKIDAIVNSIHGDEKPGCYDYLSDFTTVADCIYKAGGATLFNEIATCVSGGIGYLLDTPVITKGYKLPAKCNYSHAHVLVNISPHPLMFPY